MRVIYQDSPGVGYRVYASWFKAHHPKPRSCLRSGFEAFLAVPVQCQSSGSGCKIESLSAGFAGLTTH